MSRSLPAIGWQWSFPKDNPAGIKTLQDLTKPGIKMVIAAKEVPGVYVEQF